MVASQIWMNPYSKVHQSVLDNKENRFKNQIKQAEDKAATKAKIDNKISGYQKNLPAAIDAFDDTIHSLPVLPCVMNLKVDFIGTLYYDGTKKAAPSAFVKPAWDEAVARNIGDDEVPGIEVVSALA